MMIKRILVFFLSLGSQPSDSKELSLKKSSLVLVPLIIGPAAFIWGLLYIYLDHPISGAIPLSYSIISVFNLWHFHKTKNIMLLQRPQMMLVLLLPFMLMWSLGGFALGSFVFIWAFYAPIASLTYERENRSFYWFYAFLFLIAISVLLDSYFAQDHVSCMPIAAVEMFYFLNITAGLSGIYLLLEHFIGTKEKNAHALLQKEHEALKITTQELEEVNIKLNTLAKYDTLTQISNRYNFRENLIKMIAHAKRENFFVALFFLDLDGFKSINDNYGHAAGDKVLVEISNRLKFLLREGDTVARLGGDEFTVVLGNLTSMEYIDTIAIRIIDEINKDYESIVAPSPIGVSIGISLYPDDAHDIDSLINNADQAMYDVKYNGKNSYKRYGQE
ncbi:diguanylate cyclase domain-containing protein [Sulfurimonas sp.]|uniref:diguanylate cyclase domain-containing protein n=1 Tax=Sulfurimonas sp. TaxID=2022749 RepID=UPI0039E4DC98